jgi:hypothetical protein
MKEPKINVKLLKQIKKHILEEPRRFIMWTWKLTKRSSGSVYRSDGGNGMVEFAKCNTAACIGGWACILSGKRFFYYDAGTSARKLLGLTQNQADQLFDPYNWPPDLLKRLQTGNTPEKRAEAGADMIDHFIAANK